MRAGTNLGRFVLLAIALLLLLQNAPPALQSKVQTLTGTIQGGGDAGSHALQSRDELGAQTIHATLDATDPLGLIDIEDLAVDTGSQQVDLPKTVLDNGVMVVRVRFPGGCREAGFLGGKNREGSLHVLGGDTGDRKHSNRTDKNVSQLVSAFHVLHGGVGSAGQIVGETGIVLGARNRGQFGRSLSHGVDGTWGSSRKQGIFTGSEILDDAQGHVKNAGLDRLELDVRSKRRSRSSFSSNLVIHLLQSLGQFAANRCPFR